MNIFKKNDYYIAGLFCFIAGFAVIALAHGLPYIREGRFFIWGADGYDQMYPVFCYIKQYYSRVLESIMAGHLEVPLFDFSLGLGGDIMTTLNYYGFANIFYLLALPCPEAKLPLAYTLITIFQQLLAGCAFYALARKLGCNAFGSVIGGWLFTFSGFYLMSVQFPIMAHAALYLPLMLLGCEKVMRGESPLLLSLSTCLLSMCGFYFLVFNSAVLPFFVLLRVWERRQKRFFPAAIQQSIRCFLSYVA